MKNAIFAGSFTKYLAKRGYTQAELAKELNVSRSSVSKWEDGTNTPTAKNLQKLSEIFKLDEVERNALFVAAKKGEYLKLIPHSDSSLTQQETTQKTRSTQRIIPLQRPRRPLYFTGRDKQIEQILKDIQPGRVVTLVGPGGIGKSAIVAEVVHYLILDDEPPKHFPDGIIFHKFYGQPSTELAYEHIIGSFEEKRGQVSARDKAEDVLSKRQALLVLDGVENADDLETLLEIRGNCGVVMSTRHRHDDPEGYLHIIRKLPKNQSRAVLQFWSKGRVNDEAIADKICELVGFLPLTLRLAGSYMVQRNLEAPKYLEFLREAPLSALHLKKRQHKSIQVLIEKSLTPIDEQDIQLREVLAGVGLLAMASFASEVIEIALDISNIKAIRLLEELVDYSLLERVNDSYEVTHALVHEYVQERLTPSTTVLVRLLNYYISISHTQTKLGIEGYTRLTFERVHILSLLKQAIIKKSWKAASGLAFAVERYIFKRGNLSEYVTTSQAGILAAQHLNDWQDEIYWLTVLTQVYYQHNQLEKIITCYQQLYRITLEHPDVVKTNFSSNTNLANVNPLDIFQLYTYLLQAKDEKDANRRISENINRMEQIIELAHKSESRNFYIEFALQQMIAGHYLQTGNLEKAVKYLQDNLNLTRDFENSDFEMQTLRHIGSIYTDQHEFQQASNYFQEALSIAQKAGNLLEQKFSLGALGHLYFILDQTEQAVNHLEQVRDITQEIGFQESDYNWLNNLAQCYDSQGRSTEAIKTYNRAIDLNPILPYAFYNLAGCYLRLRQFNQAEHFFQRRADIDPESAFSALAYLGVVALHKGETDKAQAYFERAMTVWNSAYKLSLQSAVSLLELKALVLLCLDKEEEAFAMLRESLAQRKPHDAVDFLIYDLIAEAPNPPPKISQLRQVFGESIEITSVSNEEG